MPESLGNHELVLPAGVVCDACNNGVLAWLDAQLVGFEPLAMLRAMRSVPSKKGRHKTFRVPGLEVFREKNGGVRVKVKYVVPEEDWDSRVPGSIKTTFTQRMDEQLAAPLARAVLKQMLGGMYRDFGRKFVLQQQFDGLRAVILGAEPFSGLLAIKNSLDIAQFEGAPGGFTYQFVREHGRPPMWVEGGYLGLSIGATWGVRSSELDRSRVPSALAGAFSIIEVDPEFGVR